MRLARVLGAVGRVLVAAGVLVLLFVAYQLWGTSFETARAQDRLEDELAEQLDGRAAPEPPGGTTATTATTDTRPPRTVGPLEAPPETGQAVGRIEAPDIDLDWVFVEGVSVPDLKQGPGHYPGTPFPGQEGNSSIAGHRTTYGAPFNRIDELETGDSIRVTTPQGAFRYRVREQLIVDPNQVEVLEDQGDNRLTLTSCNPKYSVRERIIVVADLAGEPVEAPPAPAQRSQEPRKVSLTEQGLSGESVAKLPVIVWGIISAAIWLAAWLLGRWWRKWPAYLIGVPFFAVTLFFFFENTSRLVPANY